MARVADSPLVDPQFPSRWSPVAFDAGPLEPGLLEACLEAARFAPSSSNEQPWFFLVADEPAALARARELLVPANRRWADRAPALIVVFARRRFRRNGQENRWAAFDTGAAWMSLALQASKLGLATHAMGGFSAEAALELAGLSADEAEALCVIALGRPGRTEDLPEDLRPRQQPNARRALAESYRRL